MLFAMIWIASCSQSVNANPTVPEKGRLSGAKGTKRIAMSLDGIWEMAESKEATAPVVFDHHATVPGLADMATPRFEKVGLPDYRRNFFWYRRSFRLDGSVPPLAVLKLRKAAYGAKVWINGHEAGEHRPNFTPGYFEITRLLNGQGASNVVTVLTLDSGKLGYLVTEPRGDVYAGFSPLSDATRFALLTPGGIKVEADGQVGLCRVVVQVKSLSVDIDYCWKPGQNVDLATLKCFTITGCQVEPHVKCNGKPVKPIFRSGAYVVGI